MITAPFRCPPSWFLLFFGGPAGPPIYPENSSWLHQAQDDDLHPAQAVFLVDSDCLPSENLLDELHSDEVQQRLGREAGAEGNGSGLAAWRSDPAAIVVPCLEFAPDKPAAARVEKVGPSGCGSREVCSWLKHM